MSILIATPILHVRLVELPFCLKMYKTVSSSQVQLDCYIEIDH